MEVGENVIDAVKREIMEEAGVDIEVGEVFCIASNTGKYPGYNGVKEVPTKIMLVFICKAKSGIPSPSDENSESAYVPKDKVLDLIQAPAIIERYKAFLGYTGRPAIMILRLNGIKTLKQCILLTVYQSRIPMKL